MRPIKVKNARWIKTAGNMKQLDFDQTLQE